MHECMSILSQPPAWAFTWGTEVRNWNGNKMRRNNLPKKKKKKQIYFAHFFLGSEGREIKNFLKKIPKPCSK